MEKEVILVFLLLTCVCGLNLDLFQKPFPKDFLFGTATSAYQVEGAWNISGKSESSWDHYTHTRPEKIEDRSNGDIACDSYNKMEEDVKLMKDLGVHFYRFSLSWTRILPSPFTNNINPEGIRHYNKLIDLLLKNGIEPMVTLFHWDLPQSLQEIGGLTNSLVNELFAKYANVAFEQFGDRVKKWTTFNEPHVFCVFGYGQDLMAPAYNLSGIAEYLCGHNILKAHAKVYHLYNDTFKATQKGGVSINLDSNWYEPASSSEKDIEAAERALEFELGLYANPIFTKTGDYPAVVKEHIANRSKEEGYPETRLPPFTREEIEYIRGTHDFFCLNHYSTSMAADKKPDPIGTPSYEKDMNVNDYADPSWPATASPYNKVVPWGFTKLLVWIKKQYGNPVIYITENGYADDTGQINDTGRANFFKLYLQACLDAINKHDVRVKGYTAWSLMDNFEWMYGYVFKFGLYHVNFTDPGRPRTAKTSAKYYKKVIATRKP